MKTTNFSFTLLLVTLTSKATVYAALAPAVPSRVLRNKVSQQLPNKLAHVGLEIDLPIDFASVRQVFLQSGSTLGPDWLKSRNYQDVQFEGWDKCDKLIGGNEKLSPITVSGILGAQRKAQFRMPVKMFGRVQAYQTQRIVAYSNSAFCIEATTSTPRVPYGNKFVGQTQFLVTRSPNGGCKLICSAEPQYRGKMNPLVRRQIRLELEKESDGFFQALQQKIYHYCRDSRH